MGPRFKLSAFSAGSSHRYGHVPGENCAQFAVGRRPLRDTNVRRVSRLEDDLENRRKESAEKDAKVGEREVRIRALEMRLTDHRDECFTLEDVNSSPGMAPNVAPTEKGASSYVSRYAAVRDTIELPHIDLIGSTS